MILVWLCNGCFGLLSVMHCSYWLYLGSLLTHYTQGTVYCILFSQRFCLLFSHLLLIVLFAIFLLLSKWYTLCERNREINIQAIVEEHYERYMDQEEEYEREHGESISDSNSVYSDNDSDHAFVGRIPETYGSRCLCVCMSFHPFADLGNSYNVSSKVQCVSITQYYIKL